MGESGEAHDEDSVSYRRRSVLDQKNSPSRLRFRPPNLLAFRFHVQPSGPASTYSRSVLGARGTVRRVSGPCKGGRNRKMRSLHDFHYPHANRAILVACSREGWDQKAGPKKFADPVALSSPEPTDLPLARTASQLGFDLLTLRARRSSQSRRLTAAVQELSTGKKEKMAHFAPRTRSPLRPDPNGGRESRHD